MKKETYYYIYNLEQALFYITHGIKCEDCGIHEVTKRVWLKFKKTPRLQSVYEMWVKLGEEKKKENDEIDYFGKYKKRYK